MGDCGNLRCVQEKRYFKKALSTWHKKVPFCIGLELVAEQIAGNASGHIKTLLLPFNDMEPDELDDFNTDTDSPCTFCQGKPSTDVPIDSLEQENIPEMLSCQEQPTLNQLAKSSSEQRCNGSVSGLTSVASMPADVPVLEGLNSFYNQLAMTSLLYQQQQLQSAAVQAALAAGASSSQRQPAASTLPGTSDLALDLRAEQPESSSGLLDLSTETGGLKVPEIRTKKKEQLLKKPYSDRELDDAMDAIKSGSVGTQRAAQMHRVPRSTLRNKVFKSAEMSRQLPYNQEHINESADANDGNCDSPAAKSNTDSESSVPNSKQASPRERTENQAAVDMSQYNSLLMKQLEELQAKQGINDQLNLMSQQNRLLGEMFNPLQQLSAASYPFFMPQYSAMAAMPGLDYMNPYASSMLMPYLPEMMKNLAQKQLEMERLAQGSSHRHNHSFRKFEQTSNTKLSKKEDIKVPAYKPSAANLLTNDNELTKMTRPMVKKENVGKLSETASPFTASDYLQSMISHSPSTSKRASLLGNSSSKKRSFGEQTSAQAESAHSMSNGSKKRPKRGQYRKYDSERLADAVKAVQRGEMSVHRAGTHFGVPHSTLEYKVKERHLLRKKKIAENGESKSNQSLGTKPSAANICADTEKSTASSLTTSPKLPVSESVEKPTSLDNNTPSFMDFTPSTYHMDAPASELLMKLHAKAHQRANEIMNSAKSHTTSESRDNLGNLV